MYVAMARCKITYDATTGCIILIHHIAKDVLYASNQVSLSDDGIHSRIHLQNTTRFSVNLYL